MSVKDGVLVVLGIFTVVYCIVFIKDILKRKKENNMNDGKFGFACASGFVTNFFDALGIGCYAPLTAAIKIFKITSDRILPGTLNVACTIPVIVEAFIFIKDVKVQPLTLVSMIIASIIGAVIGAKFVSGFDEKKIQFIMGAALLIVALLMIASQLGLMPLGGSSLGLHGGKLIFAIVVNFVLGALMTVGIGLYAPCMALVFALGMSPVVAFPIMMGSCAFLMPAASIKFIKEGAYSVKASIAITIFGSIGVLIAALLVKSLPLKILTWLVVFVVFYTSITMFRSYVKSKHKVA